MATTYDTATDIGKVRLYIGDTDITAALFTDEEIQVFLDQEGSINSSAALALEVLASSEARLAQMIKTLNFTKDTRSAAKELRDQASRLREIEVGAYGYAEQALTEFSIADIMVRKALRE